MRAAPTSRQLEYQDWEFGMFLHFGIRTFYEGHEDWDRKRMSPSAFNPAELDCDQWVRTAKEAGANYVVLTAKHHDGFANWPSRTTEFSVASSPWKGGEGDVIGEFTDACRRNGIHPGLYYSPAEWGNSDFGNPRVYDEYFITQISEILTGYGHIDILWFDGCGSEGHEYDWQRITREIRRMQPNVLIFNMGDPDFRWAGNEAGVAPRPCWNVVDEVGFSIRTERKDGLGGGARWLPAECDCRMRERSWFYSDEDAHTVKSVEELMGLYYLSVGRGANLLLNVGPDGRGLLPEPDAGRLIEFGREIKRRFSNPVAKTEDFKRDGDSWVCRLRVPALVDHAVLMEDLARGESVRAFNIWVRPQLSGKEVLVYEGRNVGHKAICPFPPLKTAQVRVEVTETGGPAVIRSAELFDARASA